MRCVGCSALTSLFSSSCGHNAQHDWVVCGLQCRLHHMYAVIGLVHVAIEQHEIEMRQTPPEQTAAPTLSAWSGHVHCVLWSTMQW